MIIFNYSIGGRVSPSKNRKIPTIALAVGSRQVKIEKSHSIETVSLGRLVLLGAINVVIKREFRKLNDKFYEEYKDCPEILYKADRPYTIAIMKIDDLTFAIPFRSNIITEHAYVFKKSSRGPHAKSGLDYTKAVIIRDEHLGEKVDVDNVQYREFSEKIKVIANTFSNFIADYKKWMANPVKYHLPLANKDLWSLQYFHDELGIK